MSNSNITTRDCLKTPVIGVRTSFDTTLLDWRQLKAVKEKVESFGLRLEKDPKRDDFYEVIYEAAKKNQSEKFRSWLTKSSPNEFADLRYKTIFNASVVVDTKKLNDNVEQARHFGFFTLSDINRGPKNARPRPMAFEHAAYTNGGNERVDALFGTGILRDCDTLGEEETFQIGFFNEATGIFYRLVKVLEKEPGVFTPVYEIILVSARRIGEHVRTDFTGPFMRTKTMGEYLIELAQERRWTIDQNLRDDLEAIYDFDATVVIQNQQEVVPVEDTGTPAVETKAATKQVKVGSKKKVVKAEPAPEDVPTQETTGSEEPVPESEPESESETVAS